MENLKIFILTFCCLKFGSSQYYPGGLHQLPTIATSKGDMENSNKDMMETELEPDFKLGIKSEVLLKIALAILAYKAAAFNLVLFALIFLIPLLNPAHFAYKKFKNLG